MLKDPDRGKWSRWCDRISDELVASSVDRHVFDRWWKVVRANPRIDAANSLVALFSVSYLERQALVVRRQLDTHPDALSLAKLIVEVQAYAPQLKRDQFLNSFASPVYPAACAEAERIFDRFAGGAGGNVVSPEAVQADLEALRAAGAILLEFADRWLAHSDRKREWPKLSFGNLNDCLDLLYEHWWRYNALTTFRYLNAEAASIAGQDWEAVLDVPWRQPDETGGAA